MDAEHKLQHFFNISVQTASQQNADSLDKYKSSLDSAFDDHKNQIRHTADETILTKKNIILQSVRRDYSSKESEARRSLINLKNDIRNDLFHKVRQLISEFRQTDEYTDYLINRINYIDSVAGDDAAEIYIDLSDSRLQKTLEDKTGKKINIYDIDFSGGIRAVIPSRNILIDETLKPIFNDLHDNYQIKY